MKLLDRRAVELMALCRTTTSYLDAMPDLLTEVRKDLTTKSLDWCVTRWVMESDPFVFQSLGLHQYWDWKLELGRRLEVDPKNVMLTGSGAAGVRLNPHKTMQLFSSDSDIDVAVISSHHFDLAWRALRNLGAGLYRLTPAQRYAVRDHVSRYVYWGIIATDRILPILPFAGPWMDAIDYMQTVEPTAGRQVGVRVYKDYTALRSYAHEGLSKLRSNILGAGASQSEEIA